MSIRIGEISYTNILPMFYYVDRDKLREMGCEFIPAIPSELNAGMSKGKIDVGGISSFSYGEHIHEYELLPDLSVSSPKAVGSIFLFSKVPIDELDGKRIALTSSSATSVNLLKIILGSFYQQNVHYTTEAPDYEQMMAHFDAALLIGDDAILAKRNGDKHHYVYDLGEIWSTETGYPMTYAVFAVRKDAARKHHNELKEVMNEFHKSKYRTQLNQYEEMIESIQQSYQGDADFWRNYFAGLNNDLTKTHIEGLLHYFDLAYKQGLLKEPVQDIVIWNPETMSESMSLGGSE
ncbi:menaquinone biosynthesis protein [Salisediminibacterium selenitireducens]|uniref:Chorismate dehydratase n=1 Tax=Bacillus selenitireducens (strain ATCC 700615 / DSM 15326 / MLS10) TaxID=439292 RepID=D6XV99_BACIE|nr:menaquinone biosynthesis protein [Salisediminibacterium selenitireducens]ADH99637.1 protein of unknown function DUF178 [[Bacillus] selenitireducens MLS10]